MALTKTQKIPRGYEVQQTKYLELSEGKRPSLGQKVAPFLPVIEEDRYHEHFYVIESGQFVAFDQTSLNSGAVDNSKWLVVANGGVAQALTYTSDCIDLVVDIDAYEAGDPTVVSAAGAATKNVAANFPLGVASQNYISGAYPLVRHNYDPQPFVPVLTRHLIEIPLLYDTGATKVARSGADPNNDQATLLAGHLVMSGDGGWPVKWTSDSSVEQIAGRCVHIRSWAVRDALDKVHTVPTFALPGTGTSGRQVHENQFLNGSTSTKISRLARINLMLL